MAETLKNNPDYGKDVKDLAPNKMNFNETEKAVVKNAINDIVSKV